MALAPGFIDLHSHLDLRLFADPDLPPKTRQGVTTELLGQDGFSMAPMHPAGGAEEWEDHLSGLDGRPEREWTWGGVPEYFDAIENSGVAPNVAMLVGHGTVRYNVVGMDDRAPSEAELAEMADLVTEALEDGAVGFSTGLDYMPQVVCDTHELQTLAGRLSDYGRPFVAHIRNQSNDIWNALDEFVDIGKEEDIPLHLSHFKLMHRPQQGQADRAIGFLESARDRGVDTQAKRLLKSETDRYVNDRKLHLGKNEWHQTTLVYRRNENSEHTDHRQYSVFMCNGNVGLLSEYGYRWESKSGYRSIKRFMAATTSKDFGLRFFYFAFACLLYSIWRAVDLLVQVQLTGEYEHSPIVTADNTLTLLKKETGIG